MKTNRVTKALLTIASIAVIGGTATACGTSAASAPTAHVTVTANPATPSAGKTVTATATPAPTVTKIVVVPVAAPPTQPVLLNAEAVVTQYYADINSGDFSAAWALGGNNIGGPDYQGWVAGFDSTTGVSLSSLSYFGSDQVTVQLTATQDDGSVNVYTGTYTVTDGVIESASIVQNGSS